MIVKRVGILSLAKLLGAIYLAMGIVMGVIYGFMFLFIGLMSGVEGGGEQAVAGLIGGVVGGIAFAIMMPIMFGGMGFVGGLFVGWLYNVLSDRFGGLELELSEN